MTQETSKIEMLDFSEPPPGFGRTAAWSWYDRRLKLHERLSMLTFSGLRRPLWPRMLTWLNQEVEEVGRWAGGEMPEVLLG